MSDFDPNSVITCPHCGYMKREVMPEKACIYYYECEACHLLITPKHGDCCVFCSWGSLPCPTVQLRQHAAEQAGEPDPEHERLPPVRPDIN